MMLSDAICSAACAMLSMLFMYLDLLAGQTCQVHVTGGGDVKATVREAIRRTALYNASLSDTAHSSSTSTSTSQSTSQSTSTSSSSRPESILICGSFFILRDVRIALHTGHPYDPFDINEQSVKK